MKKFWFTAVLAVSIASAASAQVGSINSAVTSPAGRNNTSVDPINDTSSTLTITNAYPTSITISDQNVSTNTSGQSFAVNRSDWRFSSDGGATPYVFNANDFFTTSMTLTLTGTGTTSRRKEAGFYLDRPDPNTGQYFGVGQFFVDTDAHELVAINLPFYAFPKVFQSGDSVIMGMTYFLDANGIPAIIYNADDLTQNTGMLTSPAQEFTNTGDPNLGIVPGTRLGGYEQTTVEPGDATNGITAVFSNISIAATPEPSGFVALAAGVLSLGGLLLRKRRMTR